MDDLSALQGQWKIQISVHHILSDRHEEVWLIDIPKDAVSLSLEVWDHDELLIDWVEHVAMACCVDADALCASLVREDLDKWILTLMLQDEGLVLDQVVAQLATLVDEQEEGVGKSDVDDRRITSTERETDIRGAFILDQVQ